MPYTSPPSCFFDSGEFEEVMNRCMAAAMASFHSGSLEAAGM